VGVEVLDHRLGGGDEGTAADRGLDELVVDELVRVGLMQGLGADDADPGVELRLRRLQPAGQEAKVVGTLEDQRLVGRG
jgi:hypothetical protein